MKDEVSFAFCKASLLLFKKKSLTKFVEVLKARSIQVSKLSHTVDIYK